MFFAWLFFQKKPSLLIRVREATHAGHDAEHVVIDGIDAQLLGEVGRGNVGMDREQERGVVNARHVARARGLVVLGLDGKRIHVDAGRVRDVGVVLVGLHEVKVRALALREPVVAVEQQLGGPHAVLRAGPAKHVRVGETRQAAVGQIIDVGAPGKTGVIDRRTLAPKVVDAVLAPPLVGGAALAAAKVASVAETGDGAVGRGKLALRPLVETSVVVIHHGAVERALGRVIDPLIHAVIDDVRALDHPHQLLDGVVKVEARLVRRARKGLLTRELQLVNEVLVRDLGEAATLVRVEVDVIDVQRRVLQVGVEHRGHIGGLALHTARNVAVGGAVKLNVNDDLVVLQGNQGQGQTGVAAKEKLQGNVQRRLRLLVDVVGGSRCLTTSLGRRERERVTNHALVARLEARRQRELVEDLEPVTVVKVNALATNLELRRANKNVPQRINPAERVADNRHGRNIHLQVHAVNQVTVARNCAAHTLAKIRRAVERLLNRLHGKVGVAAIHHLEKGNLGITRKINVLCAVSD